MSNVTLGNIHSLTSAHPYEVHTIHHPL